MYNTTHINTGMCVLIPMSIYVGFFYAYACVCVISYVLVEMGWRELICVSIMCISEL